MGEQLLVGIGIGVAALSTPKGMSTIFSMEAECAEVCSSRRIIPFFRDLYFCYMLLHHRGFATCWIYRCNASEPSCIFAMCPISRGQRGVIADTMLGEDQDVQDLYMAQSHRSHRGIRDFRSVDSGLSAKS